VKQRKSETQLTVPPDKLTRLVELCAQLTKAELDESRAEEALEKAKKVTKQLEEELIPDLMHEIGVTELRLSAGAKVSIKQDVYASIPEELKPAAYKWLEDNQFGGLIKSAVSVPFGRGELEKAKELIQQLEALGLPAEFEESLHHQTMKAFLREQLAKKKPVPLDLFGARPVWVTKISN